MAHSKNYTLKCGDCGKVRHVVASRYRKAKREGKNLCRSCENRRRYENYQPKPKERKIICPVCGEERTVTQAQIKKINAGHCSGKCMKCANQREKSTRRVGVTCSVCGKVYEVNKSSRDRAIKERGKIVCRDCYKPQGVAGKTRIVSNGFGGIYVEKEFNGRKCRKCKRDLWGGYWFFCPDCHNDIEATQSYYSDYTGYMVA